MEILQKSHVKYGLIMCGVVIVCLFLMEITGGSIESKSPFLAFSTMIAPLFVWYFGLSALKKRQKNKLTLKQGIRESFNISLVFAVLSPFIFLLYYLLFNMDAVDYARNAYGLGNASNTLVIIVDMLVQFVASIIGGTVYGTVISFFLKSKKQ